MKLYFFIGLIIIIFLTSCSSKSKEAAEYNNSIILEQRKIAENLDSLFIALLNFNVSSIDKFYNKAVLQTSIALENLRKKENFYEDSSLKHSAIKLFETYRNILSNEMLIVIREFKPPLTYFSPKKENYLQEKLTKIDENISIALSEFQTVQKNFSNKYKFELKP